MEHLGLITIDWGHKIGERHIERVVYGVYSMCLRAQEVGERTQGTDEPVFVTADVGATRRSARRMTLRALWLDTYPPGTVRNQRDLSGKTFLLLRKEAEGASMFGPRRRIRRGPMDRYLRSSPGQLHALQKATTSNGGAHEQASADQAPKRTISKNKNAKKKSGGTEPGAVCINPDEFELCISKPPSNDRRKKWRGHYDHYRMMQGLTSVQLSSVVKKSTQKPAELHADFDSARTVRDKQLCAITTAPASTESGIMCPNCFQKYIRDNLPATGGALTKPSPGH